MFFEEDTPEDHDTRGPKFLIIDRRDLQILYRPGSGPGHRHQLFGNKKLNDKKLKGQGSTFKIVIVNVST